MKEEIDMKKMFEPLKIEIYYYEEQDIVRTSPDTPSDWTEGENELPMVKPSEFYN